MIATNAYLHPTYRTVNPMASSRKVVRVLDQRPSVTAEDIRIHAWINERLAVVHREQHGLWAKVNRLFSGVRPTA